ncbi:MAG: hypothetical protein WCR42_06750 [bacterium]
MKIKIQTLIFGFALCFFCTIVTNAQVVVTFTAPPTTQFKLENMWNVTLMNPTRENYKVYLIGRATERQNGNIVMVKTTIFNLPPGLKIVNSRELAPLKVLESNSRYSDVINNVGTVPSGDYDICITVYDSYSDRVLGEMCMQTYVRNLTQVDLLYPEDGASFSYPEAWEQPTVNEDESSDAIFTRQMNKVDEPTKKETAGAPVQRSTNIVGQTSTISSNGSIPCIGGIITFNWLPPAPLPYGAKVSYTLKLVEIFGYQSAYDAMKSNLNTLIIANIPTSMVQVPAAARRLRPGARYAWGIDVYLNGSLIQESESRSFTIEGNQSGYNNRENGIDYGADGKVYPDEFNYSGNSNRNLGFNQPTMYGNNTQGYSYPYSYPNYSINSGFQGAEPTSGSNSKQTVIPIAFYGSASLEGQLASRVGSYSEVPRNYFNAYVNPGIKLYGLPFSVSGLYSTQQDSSRQNMNSIRFNFDFESMRQGLATRLQDAVSELEAGKSLKMDEITKVRNLSQKGLDSAKALSKDELDKLGNAGKAEIERAKALKAEKLNQIRNMSEIELDSLKKFNADELKKLRDPKNLTENLKQYASISGVEKLFMSVRQFGVGTNYPSYSEYMLNGVPVTGLNIELNPGIFYTAFTAQKNQRPIDNIAFRRDIYAGRIGIGKKEGTHLFFNGMYAVDDGGSITLAPTNQMLTARENYVFGMDTKLNLIGSQLFVEGEGSISLLTRDTRAPEFISPSIPSELTAIATPRLSSSVDFVYSGRLVYVNDKSATKISAGIKMVGPGYASLGVPNLRSDQFGFEGKFDQKLFKNHVTFSSFYRNFKDNLIDWKSSTTTVTSYSLNLGINFPKIPYLRLSYSPTQQINDAKDNLLKIDNNITVFMAMSGYTFKIGKKTMLSTTLSVVGQKLHTINPLGRYSTTSYMIGEMISFRLPLTVGVNAGIIETQNVNGYTMLQNIEITASAPLSEVIAVGGGLSFASERKKDERLGFYANTTIRVSNKIDFDLRLERTTYNEFLLTANNYGEFLLRTNLSLRI